MLSIVNHKGANLGFIRGLIGGITIAFAIASAFLMEPENMLRWVIHPESTAVKVERAFKDPEKLVADLKKQLQNLNQELLESKSQQISIIDSLKRQISEKNKDYEILQNNLSDLNRQVVYLKTELDKKQSIIEKKDELMDTLRTNDLKPEKIKNELLLKKLRLESNTPAVFFDGKLSLLVQLVDSAFYDCDLKVRSSFNPDERIDARLKIGEPIEFKIDGREHTIYLLDTEHNISSPDYVIIDIYPVETD